MGCGSTRGSRAPSPGSGAEHSLLGHEKVDGSRKPDEMDRVTIQTFCLRQTLLGEQGPTEGVTFAPHLTTRGPHPGDACRPRTERRAEPWPGTSRAAGEHVGRQRMSPGLRGRRSRSRADTQTPALSAPPRRPGTTPRGAPPALEGSAAAHAPTGAPRGSATGRAVSLRFQLRGGETLTAALIEH